MARTWVVRTAGPRGTAVTPEDRALAKGVEKFLNTSEKTEAAGRDSDDR